MKFLIYIIVFFLMILNGIMANKVANSLIQDSCKKAAKHAETHYYKFCITSIKENPESQKVRNVDELTIIGVKNAMSNMTNVKRIVENILMQRKYRSKLNVKLLRDCLKLYSEGDVWLTKALEYIKMRDYENVHESIGDARTVPRACEMGFNGDNQQISPVTKENDVLFLMVDIPQAFNFYAHISTS